MASLYFYYGSMNSAKSANLLTSAYNYQEQGMNPLCLKPLIDTRDGGQARITSRVVDSREALLFGDQENLFKLVMSFRRNSGQPVHAVFVDEAQFLTLKQVKELYHLTDSEDIPVLCYGLRTDFRGELFPGSAALLANADNIHEVRGMCRCGKKSTHVVRLDNQGKAVLDGPQVQIGGNDTYQADCRRCFTAMRTQ